MYKVGTVCVKIAGRDAGRKCVIVELKDSTALIEGETRRRKCNLRHLEPVGSVDVKAKADHATVMKALGLTPRESKSRKPSERPRRQRKIKPKKADKKPKKPKVEKKPAAKAVKKTVKKKAVKSS